MQPSSGTPRARHSLIASRKGLAALALGAVALLADLARDVVHGESVDALAGRVLALIAVTAGMVWLVVSLRRLSNNEGADIERWTSLEEELTHQAFHDALTGLPNRALYIDRLEHTLGRRRRPAKGAGVLFLDLDDFKTVNDSLGHVEGDSLIAQVAARLAGAVRPGDTAARLGGDEFALLLDDVDEVEALAVADRVLEAFQHPFELAQRPLRVSVSIGIALSTSGLTTATDLLRAADIAMYHAKDAGKGQYRLFEPIMQQETTDRLRLGVDLRGAVERGEFVLHYQPCVRLPGETLVGVEALVRWNHPERGLIQPSEFIPLAESSGLIIALGEFVLREACRQARAWQLARGDRPPIMMNVNLSGLQLEHPGIVATVSLALEESGLPAENLTLEITESVMARESDDTIRRLRQLKGLGVGLAIDDFGTGYSSLSYLRRFPIDLVKIDKSFVDGIANGTGEQALARAIVRLAHSLKTKTVAEGVESEAQVKRLTSMGCDFAQGFYFSHPLDAARATEYVVGHAAITMWVGHSGPELEVIRSVVTDFEDLNPGIRVEVVGGVTDDRIAEALRKGVGPTVVSTFPADTFGTYFDNGWLLDLAPSLARAGIDMGSFTEATLTYTGRGAQRWALPMLADAYGLYVNRKLFAEAGISEPPRTIAELTDYAKRLTKRDPDGTLRVVGFDPMLGFYENNAGTFGHMFGARWLDADGTTGLSVDPAWARMLRWQKELVDWYGHDELVAFHERVGNEFSRTNAFHTGRLAMSLDGEWRVAFLESHAPELDYDTAPVPVDAGQESRYGSGYINGTVIGIPSEADSTAEGWKLVRYLTMDDRAQAKLSNGLRNVPSTKSARHAPSLRPDPQFAVFLDIFAHPLSSSTPLEAMGQRFDDLVNEFVMAWQSGEVRDLEDGLRKLDRALDAPGPRRARSAA